MVTLYAPIGTGRGRVVGENPGSRGRGKGEMIHTEVREVSKGKREEEIGRRGEEREGGKEGGGKLKWVHERVWLGRALMLGLGWCHDCLFSSFSPPLSRQIMHERIWVR